MSNAARKLEPLELHFALSPDETSASLQVSWRAQKLHLGTHAHHRCLVALAERRVADAASGVRPTEQGWLTRDALRIVLELEPSQVNVLIFRARHQWMNALPTLGELIERRRDAFRLASLPFEIQRNGVAQARYPTALLQAAIK